MCPKWPIETVNEPTSLTGNLLTSNSLRKFKHLILLYHSYDISFIYSQTQFIQENELKKTVVKLGVGKTGSGTSPALRRLWQ
jgi:hypothetical protein